MKFKSPPVNSLSLDLLTEFCISLEKLENDRACRGVIFTSVRVVLSWGTSCGAVWQALPVFGLLAPWLLAQDGQEAALAAERGEGVLGRAVLLLPCPFLAEE